MTNYKLLSVRSLILSVLVVVAAGLLVLAGLSIWEYFGSRDTGPSMPSNQVLTTTTNTPSEANPGLVADAYTVPADQPRAVQIPGLKLEAYVQRVGVDAANKMVAPDNIHFTGWYSGSAAPGNKGISIINGHAGGRYQDGAFKHIVGLKPGDAIRVQMGDLSWREFTVASAMSYSISEADKALFKDDPTIQNELHLITCDGGFNDKTQTYDRRFIVVAQSV